MSLATTARFLRSVHHTRPHQLAWRLRLMAKRRLLERFGRLFDADKGARTAAAPEPAKVLPKPIFPPRAHLAAGREGEPIACFLAQKRSLVPPVDWRPRAWESGTRLRTIHLHSMEYLEGLADADLERTIDHWIEANPPYVRGYWKDTWNAFTLSIRVVVWMQQLAGRAGRLDAGFVARAHGSLARQMRFLASNLEHDIGGNHAIKNAKALVWAGRYFAGPEADAWTEAGKRLLRDELPDQLLSDGMHFERSPAYHQQVFADLCECASVLDDGPWRHDLLDVLDRMARPLVDLTHPDGSPSQFGDGGLDMAYSPGECLEAFRRVGGRSPKPRRFVRLPDAGYFGLRDEDTYLLFDTGAIAPDHLPAHGHGDALSFEWTVRGERMIVDAGVFEYDPGPWREHVRSTFAHNTLTLDDRDQAEFYGAFRIGRRPEVLLMRYERGPRTVTIEGAHDGYAHLPGAPIHTRRVTAGPNSLAVHDNVEGGKGQKAVARLLLHPEVRVRRAKRGFLLKRGDVTVRLETSAEVGVIDAWWCPNFYERYRAKQLVLRYGPAPCGGSFVLSTMAARATASERRRLADSPSLEPQRLRQSSA